MKYSVIDIENIHVRSNEHGTYNLNDLHKAAIAGGLAKNGKYRVNSYNLMELRDLLKK